jgi:hypothetical protein
MRNAASDLRRQDPNQASERGARALEKLRDLEQQLQAGGPDERRRALGDLQMEARQLAEAERQAASEAAKAGRDDAAADALRRLAGDQERLAERARRVQEGLKQAGSAAASPGATNKQADGNRQRAASDAAREIERQRLPDRMRDTAASLRSAAGQSSSTKPDPAKAREQAAKTSRDQQEIARAFDKLADALANADRPADAASQKLADERARAQALRQQLDQLTNELSKLDEQARSGAQQGRAGASQKSNDQSGKPAQGGAGGGTGSADVAQLRDEYTRELQKVKELVDELRREDPTLAQGGVGFTFEGQGMVLSAPGTEAFKQDFSRWEQLRQQATQALETAETSLSKKLQEKEARDRLAAGADDKAPAAYQSQVDSYFKALAKKKN